MTIKTHYVFLLLAAIVAGAWPLVLPNAYSASTHTAAAQIEASHTA